MLEGNCGHLGEILVEEEGDLLRLQALRGSGEILDIGEEDSELLAPGVNGDVLLTAENALVDLRREIVRDLGRDRDEEVIGGLEISIEALQASIELHFLLLQQRHFVGFLLHLAGRVAGGGDVEQHHLSNFCSSKLHRNLCVLDSRPREVDTDMIGLLHDLAALAEIEPQKPQPTKN